MTKVKMTELADAEQTNVQQSSSRVTSRSTSMARGTNFNSGSL